MIFDDGDLRLKKIYKKSQNKFGGFNYLLYLCNTKKKTTNYGLNHLHNQ